MDTQPQLGEKEALILIAVWSLGEDAYGANIWRELEKMTETSESLGGLTTLLNRLVGKQFLISWFGEATAVRGGRAKRYFKITAAGQNALQERELVEKARAARWDAAKRRVPAFGGSC